MTRSHGVLRLQNTRRATLDPRPVTFPSKVHPGGDNALAVRNAGRNERKHERLVLVQVDEVHGVYRVDLCPVDAPAAVGHVRAKAAVVAVAQIMHGSERAGLVGALRVPRRDSEVVEEVRAPLFHRRRRPRTVGGQELAVAEHGDEPDDVLRGRDPARCCRAGLVQLRDGGKASASDA